MPDTMNPPSRNFVTHPATPRRTVLISIASGLILTLSGPTHAQPPSAEEQGNFLRISEFLTGRTPLDPAEAARLFAALTQDDPNFPHGAGLLVRYVDEHQPDPTKLQAMLDNDKPGFEALPRRIVTAWYLGLVGENERARCVAYETALFNVVVADWLKPPSYCFGTYGSWAAKPGEEPGHG
jgi:hypothetical protein